MGEPMDMANLVSSPSMVSAILYMHIMYIASFGHIDYNTVSKAHIFVAGQQIWRASMDI